MKKNIDKWNFYKDMIDERTRIFLQPFIDSAPQVFYKVEGYNVSECKLIKVEYSHDRPVHFYGKNPSNEDVRVIAERSTQDIDFTEDRVYLCHEYEWGSGFKAKTSINPHKIFLTREDAQMKADIVKKEYDERQAFQTLHKKDASYDYNANGYKFLGWQNGWKHVYFDSEGNITTDQAKAKSFGYAKEDYPEYGKCNELKHHKISVQHNPRGSENTVSCPICMIYWKYDCSD